MVDRILDNPFNHLIVVEENLHPDPTDKGPIGIEAEAVAFEVAFERFHEEHSFGFGDFNLRHRAVFLLEHQVLREFFFGLFQESFKVSGGSRLHMSANDSTATQIDYDFTLLSGGLG